MPDFFGQVISSTASRICVIAVPGGGKTTGILIPKATQILADQGIDPREVLLLTFSRLSAIDLKNRVKTMQRLPRASTVHSYCLSFLLSEDNHEIRTRVENILLDFEKEVLVSDLKLTFPHIHKNVLERQLGEFSAGWATKPRDEVFEEDDTRRAFKAAVMNWLSETEAAMMEEIIYYAVDLAKKLPDAKLIDEPRYIFVDEFQDLNRLEQEFIELLAAKSALILVVGDPDQSIYSFKYAYPVGISRFAEGPGVEKHYCYVTRRCPRRVAEYANQLLRQASPSRTDLLQTREGAELGEVHFVQNHTQEGEFASVLRSIAARIQDVADAEHVVVLVPRRKLGSEFVQYANSAKEAVGIPAEATFAFVSRPEFTQKERERVLLFGLLVKPNSLIHLRAYLGLGDNNHFAPEVAELKSKYGNLSNVLRSAKAADFPKRNKRIQRLCERVGRLCAFLEAHGSENQSVTAILDELFPQNDPELAVMRGILDRLREDDDTPGALYAKFIDYVRTVPHDERTVRVMTLMGSKGLEADHVYILGCNAGNMPGKNRSSHLAEHDHLEEQRRLLYVAFTRAKKSLTVSWSRHIPFRQSKGHYTASVGIVRIRGKPYSRVGMSRFLQDLSGVIWEKHGG